LITGAVRVAFGETSLHLLLRVWHRPVSSAEHTENTPDRVSGGGV